MHLFGRLFQPADPEPVAAATVLETCALRHLLRLEEARAALKQWLLVTETSQRRVELLALAVGFGYQLAACKTRDEAAKLLLEELGPRHLGAQMPSNVEGAFAMLRARAEEACAELASECLPKFTESNSTNTHSGVRNSGRSLYGFPPSGHI